MTIINLHRPLLNPVALDSSENASAGEQVDAHILPCQISHTGPANISTYFSPSTNADTVPISTFRGRELHGTKLNLPAGWVGHAYAPSTTFVPPPPSDRDSLDGEGDEAEEQTEEEVAWQSTAQFRDVMVWGWGEQPRAEKDVWVKGVEEWIGVAGVVHGKRLTQEALKAIEEDEEKAAAAI
ncbi:hypothetical protein YB2330_000813 [Saitoella coloradoensis]